MKRIRIDLARWVLLCGVALASAIPASVRAQTTPSYGELAGQMLCGSLEEIVVGLTNLNEGTLPHEAKELRKEVRRFRSRLDLFAFAYPVGQDQDMFLKLRKDVDKGYERMGDFKDLFDAQRIELAEYDAEDDEWSEGVRPEAVTYSNISKMASRREKVLEWRDKFIKPEQIAEYRAYICAPDLEQFHSRPAEDLSRFYWGGDEGIVPREELSGIDNFRFLTAELLTRALATYPTVMQLRDLEGDAAEVFHDFRKRARSVVKIADDIEILPKKNKKAGKLHDLMDDVDDGYGDLNDVILDLGLAVDSGNEAKVLKLRVEIAQEWTELREWQVEEKVAQRMEEYAALLRSLIKPAR